MFRRFLLVALLFAQACSAFHVQHQTRNVLGVPSTALFAAAEYVPLDGEGKINLKVNDTLLDTRRV
jgi:hypothetical protein